MSNGYRGAIWVVVSLGWLGLPVAHGECEFDSDCDDGIFCTIDLCLLNNCVSQHNDGQCNDGQFCNGTEYCDAVTDQCASGPPPQCDPGLFCSNALGRCVECEVNADCDDGLFCNGTETCNNGLCQSGNPVNCSFLDTECAQGVCDESINSCTLGPNCYDGNACTDDVCTPGVGCSNPVNYQVGVECCNPNTGATTIIDDGDDCTTDSCNAATGQVTHTPITCSDGDPCTFNDTCQQGGGCAGTDVTTVPCTTNADCPVGSCQTSTGFCQCASCGVDGDCNDGVACTVNTCVNSVCQFTPDHDFCATASFCAQESCDVEFGCVPAPLCTPTDGNPCPDPGTCSESTDTCGNCNAPAVVSAGPRYINITPAAQGATTLALRVTGECSDSSVSCVSSYVDFDNPVDPSDPKAARLVASPVFRTSAQWGTVHVRGVNIIPNRTYRVSTSCNFGGSPVLSAATVVKTWRWGDTNNDLVVDIMDVSRAVTAFQGQFSPTLTRENTDMSGVSGCEGPDRDISIVDISRIVDAFSGAPFACGNICP